MTYENIYFIELCPPDMCTVRNLVKELAASKAKCRWCVLGHRDPDIRHLERYSLTPQTSSIYTFLFVAAVLQREVTLGDLKSAFMQSDEDVSDRPKGKLYASLPPGGIPLPDGTWVEEGSLIQLNAAVYDFSTLPLLEGKQLCAALKILVTEDRVMTRVSSV